MGGGDVLWSRKGVDDGNNNIVLLMDLLFIISVLLRCR